MLGILQWGDGTSERVLMLQWSSWELESQLRCAPLLTCHHYHREDGATTGETVFLIEVLASYGVHPSPGRSIGGYVCPIP